jgi:CDK inhibitor PHO81
MSPAIRPSSVAAKSQEEPALVTASSLSGEYIRLEVQVTRDGVPVIYSHFKLPVDGIDVGVSSVTYAQFQALAKAHGRDLPPTATATTIQDWRDTIAKSSMASVEAVLRLVPADVGLNLCLKYTREFDAQSVGISRSLEVNAFVEAVLQTVYDAGQETPGRKILFSSFDPTVCTALNWKQPNCEL